ncbi:MAG: hypothetical protein HKO86_04855 [Gammaproteobacteria bacterium]|nr:hypothetical protein [Gammaproteobacteria bacterium]
MIKNSFIVLLVLVFTASASWAETFTNEDYGYTIEVDDSFEMVRNDHATYFRSKENDAVIIIRNWPGLDEDTARNYLQHGYQDKYVAITPAGELKAIEVSEGKGLLADAQAIVERELMKGVVGGLVGNQGQGMIVVIMVASENWEKLEPVAQETAASVKFIDYRTGPDARDWYYMLAGARLSLRGTSSDRSKREDIYFCSDGSFKHRMSSTAIREHDSGASVGFSGRTRSGSWEVVDDEGNSRLVMQYADGREKSAIIEDREGQTLLDGQRFYMMRNSRCR